MAGGLATCVVSMRSSARGMGSGQYPLPVPRLRGVHGGLR